MYMFVNQQYMSFSGGGVENKKKKYNCKKKVLKYLVVPEKSSTFAPKFRLRWHALA